MRHRILDMAARLARAGLRFGQVATSEYRYVGERWPESASALGGGWDRATVANAYAAQWPNWEANYRGAGPLAKGDPSLPATALEIVDQGTLMVFAYAFARAARGRDALRLLDWGGGIGQYRLLCEGLFPDIALDYHCKDLPSLVERGAAFSPGATFHADDGCLDSRYDLVLASGSLQYAEDWRATLRRLAGATGRYLLVTRLPIVQSRRSFVQRQDAQRHGYGTDYVGWVLRRSEFLDAAESAGIALVREFVVSPAHPTRGISEWPDHRGFLFRREA